MRRLKLEEQDILEVRRLFQAGEPADKEAARSAKDHGRVGPDAPGRPDPRRHGLPRFPIPWAARMAGTGPRSHRPPGCDAMRCPAWAAPISCGCRSHGRPTSHVPDALSASHALPRNHGQPRSHCLPRAMWAVTLPWAARTDGLSPWRGLPPCHGLLGSHGLPRPMGRHTWPAGLPPSQRLPPSAGQPGTHGLPRPPPTLAPRPTHNRMSNVICLSAVNLGRRPRVRRTNSRRWPGRRARCTSPAAASV